jgi:hypothetical protein
VLGRHIHKQSRLRTRTGEYVGGVRSIVFWGW